MSVSFRLPEPLVPLSLVQPDDGCDVIRPLSGARAPHGRVIVDGREFILMSSYSYLGLNGHPEIDAAAKAAIDLDGTGIHGSRLVTGTLSIHRKLEKRIAQFCGQEDAILYSSGYVANVATISALMSPGDQIFCDVMNHASIQDGCRMSGAELVVTAHNNVKDLRNRIERAPKDKNKLIVVDAVYSMEGDIPDLPAILGLAEAHGALVMVDEAHSCGVIGKTGRGIEQHFGLPSGSIPLKMGTLSKTIPSQGGYLAASARIVDLLRRRARGYIFSSALTAPAAAAALAAIDVIERETWRVERLQANAENLRNALHEAGISTARSETAVIPAICGASEAALAVSRYCFRHQVLATPVVYPAVQRHLSRLRLIPLASHCVQDLDHVVSIIIDAFDEARIARGQCRLERLAV